MAIMKLRRRIFEAKKTKKYRVLRMLKRLMLSSSLNILYSIRKFTYGSGRKIPRIYGFTIKRPN